MPMLYATRDRTSSGMVLRDLLTLRSALLRASRIDAVAVPCGALQWVATMDSSSTRLGAEAKALTASRRVALSPHRVGTEMNWRLPKAALHSAPRSRVTARHCCIAFCACSQDRDFLTCTSRTGEFLVKVNDEALTKHG